MFALVLTNKERKGTKACPKDLPLYGFELCGKKGNRNREGAMDRNNYQNDTTDDREMNA